MSNLKTAAFGNKRNAKQTLIDALPDMERAQCVVIVWVDENDVVRTSWADGGMLRRVGMCEVAKMQMIDDAFEPL